MCLHFMSCIIDEPEEGIYCFDVAVVAHFGR